MHIIKQSKLVFRLSKANLRYTVLSLVGISLAISFFATSFIYVDSNRAFYYNTLYEEEVLTSDFLFANRGDITGTYNVSRFERRQQQFNRYLDEYGIDDLLVEHPRLSLYWILREHVNFLNQSGYRKIVSYDYHAEILDNCRPNSSLPTAWNEIILYSSEDTTPYGVGDNITISYPYQTKDNTDKTYNFSVILTGIITPKTLQNSTAINFLLKQRKSVYTYEGGTYFHEGCTVLCRAVFFPGFVEHIDAAINPDLEDPNEHTFTTTLLYTLNTSTLNRYNIVKQTRSLEKFLEEVSQIHLDYFSFLEMGYDTRESYYRFSEEVFYYEYFQFEFLLFSIPVFILATYFVYLSLRFINEKRSQNIILWRMRGISKRLVFFTLGLETVVITVLSIICALGLGLVFTAILDTTSGFLEFTKQISSFKFFITPSTIKMMFLIGFLVTIISNIKSIWSLSRSSIATLAQLTTGSDRTKIFSNEARKWDVFCVIQGGIGFIVLASILEIVHTTSKNEILQILFPIIAILLVLSPLIFLVGALSVLNRLVPKLLQKIGKFFWNKNWQLPAISSRNLLASPNLTKATTLLIALSMSMLIALAVLPISAYHHGVSTVYYKVGADAKIQAGDFLDLQPTILDDMEELGATLDEKRELNATTLSYTEERITIDEESYERETIRILGIERKFAQIAYWQSSFHKKSLHQLVEKLYNATTEKGIIIHQRLAHELNLETGDTFNLSIRGETFSTQIVEQASYWPMSSDELHDMMHPLFVILRKNALDTFEQTVDHDARYTKTILCSFNDKTTKNEVDTILESKIEPSIETLGLGSYTTTQVAIHALATNPSDPLDMKLWIISNFNFWANMLICTTTFILYSFMKLISKKNEMGLARSIGMKFKQLAAVHILESVLLFVLSVIPASIMCILLLGNLTAVIHSFSSFVIPFTLLLDFYAFGLIIGVLFVTVLSLSMVMTRKIYKMNVAQMILNE